MHLTKRDCITNTNLCFLKCIIPKYIKIYILKFLLTNLKIVILYIRYTIAAGERLSQRQILNI